MFRRKQRSPIEVTRLTSLVSDNVEVEGDLHFSGGLRVDGRIVGNVIGKDDEHGLLVLSEKGSITGRVKVHDAVVNGRIDGDLEVEHFLELQASARVTGNISYRQLRMDCGATVDGKLERKAGADGSTAEAADGKIVALIGTPQVHVTSS